MSLSCRQSADLDAKPDSFQLENGHSTGILGRRQTRPRAASKQKWQYEEATSSSEDEELDHAGEGAKFLKCCKGIGSLGKLQSVDDLKDSSLCEWHQQYVQYLSLLVSMLKAMHGFAIGNYHPLDVQLHICLQKIPYVPMQSVPKHLNKISLSLSKASRACCPALQGQRRASFCKAPGELRKPEKLTRG